MRRRWSLVLVASACGKSSSSEVTDPIAPETRTEMAIHGSPFAGEPRPTVRRGARPDTRSISTGFRSAK